MRYTKSNLQKIEDLFKELGYVIRYEKGSFKSGYCLVESKKVAVVNRFFEAEERFNSLLDILSKIELDTEQLSDTGKKTFKAAFAVVPVVAATEATTSPQNDAL